VAPFRKDPLKGANGSTQVEPTFSERNRRWRKSHQKNYLTAPRSKGCEDCESDSSADRGRTDRQLIFGVVVVKKFVVAHEGRAHAVSPPWERSPTAPLSPFGVNPVSAGGTRGSYLEQMSALEVGNDCLDRLAWNNRWTAGRRLLVGMSAVMMNRGARGQPYRRGRGEIR
jgi:hypothetical protein